MGHPEGGFNPVEHTQLAAERALELLEKGELKQAVDSMVSDVDKDPTRPEEQKRMIGMMGMALKNDPKFDAKMVREFIEGFPEVSIKPKWTAPKPEIPRPEAPQLPKRTAPNSTPETRRSPEAPQLQKAESSEEERNNAEDFIVKFISGNEGLTPAAKEMVENKARSERGPWSVKDFVTGVTQDGNKVIIKNKSGERYLHVQETK